MSNQNKKPRKEVRVTGVPTEISNDLIGISKYHGVSLSDFLRPKLREIADEYPDHVKNYKGDS